MYLVPQPYRCPKCGFESNYGPHDPFGAPVLSEGPVCPQCYANFLRKYCGVMAPEKVGFTSGEKEPGANVQNTYL